MTHRIAIASMALIVGMAPQIASAREGRWRDVRIEVRQNGARNPAAGNASSVVQEGRGNAASVVQSGAGNAAGIQQFGRDNTGAVTQTGANNTACFIQVGRNLAGGIDQVGDNQTGGVLQTRWGATDIPSETCAANLSRGDLAALGPERPEGLPRGRARARNMIEP